MTVTPLPVRRPILGVVVIVVSILGAIAAVLLGVLPPAVGPEQWSYPYEAGPYLAGQIFIAFHHLVLAVGFLAAWRIGLAGSSRLAAAGAISSVVAMALFAATEVASGLAGGETVDSEAASALNSAYGVLTIVLAAASLVFGVAILRARAWIGVTRLTLLVSGIYLLVPLIPAQFAPLPIRAAALAVWCLLYLGLGIGLRRGVTR